MILSIQTKPSPEELGKIIAAAGEGATGGIKRILNVGAMNIANRYKQAVAKGPHSGRWYRHRGAGLKDHQASAPGQAPATDTGRLLSSIAFNAGRTFAEAGATVKYAPWLEKGTRRMKPRPALLPALEREEPKILHEIDRLLRRFGS